MDLNAGDEVMIFVDPITRDVKEGQARLVERISVDGTMERWWVTFLDGFDTKTRFHRYVLAEPLPADPECEQKATKNTKGAKPLVNAEVV